MRPSQYTDDWQYLETAPSPAHYQDFADLAKQVAERYPEVKYFQVWNELKGFYDASTNQWDYADYTTLYNMVYDAIKSVRPDAKLVDPISVLITGQPQTRVDGLLRTPHSTINRGVLSIRGRLMLSPTGWRTKMVPTLLSLMAEQAQKMARGRQMSLQPLTTSPRSISGFASNQMAEPRYLLGGPSGIPARHKTIAILTTTMLCLPMTSSSR